MTKLSVCRLFVSVLCVSFLFLFSTIFMLHVFYGLEFCKLSHPPQLCVCVCVLSLAIFLHHCTFAKSTGFRREFYFHFIFCIIFYSLAVSSIEHCVCPSMFPSSRSSWLVSSSKLWYETVIETNHINRAHQSTVHSQSTHKVNPFIELKCNEFIFFVVVSSRRLFYPKKLLSFH